MKLKLTTTNDQFRSLYEALDKTRRTSSTVKVDRAAIINLLLDYSRALGMVGRDNYEEAS